MYQQTHGHRDGWGRGHVIGFGRGARGMGMAAGMGRSKGVGIAGHMGTGRGGAQEWVRSHSSCDISSDSGLRSDSSDFLKGQPPLEIRS